MFMFMISIISSIIINTHMMIIIIISIISSSSSSSSTIGMFRMFRAHVLQTEEDLADPPVRPVGRHVGPNNNNNNNSNK